MIHSSATRSASSALRQIVRRSGSLIVRTIEGATITARTGPCRAVLLARERAAAGGRRFAVLNASGPADRLLRLAEPDLAADGGAPSGR
jgi:hypothetical protein